MRSEMSRKQRMSCSNEVYVSVLREDLRSRVTHVLPVDRLFSNGWMWCFYSSGTSCWRCVNMCVCVCVCVTGDATHIPHGGHSAFLIVLGSHLL